MSVSRKIHEQFRDVPEAEARMVAAYNAGPSRAVEWSRVDPARKYPIGSRIYYRIDIPLTKAYVISIMQRYRQIKNGNSSAALEVTSPPIITIYSACWVLPVSEPPIEDGAVAVDGGRIVGVGHTLTSSNSFPRRHAEDFGQAFILPGLVNTHTQLDLRNERLPRK